MEKYHVFQRVTTLDLLDCSLNKDKRDKRTQDTLKPAVCRNLFTEEFHYKPSTILRLIEENSRRTNVSGPSPLALFFQTPNGEPKGRNLLPASA